MADMTLTLRLAGLPCVLALTNEHGGVDAEFERPLTAEEWDIYQKLVYPPSWGEVRAERDRRLAACDWSQLADAVLNVDERAAWAKYRQALRDVPQAFATAAEVVWPVKEG